MNYLTCALKHIVTYFIKHNNKPFDAINENSDNHGRKGEMNNPYNAFLKEDYTQSFYMLRHYDDANWSITKFVFSEMLVAVGACWTIYVSSKSANSSIGVDSANYIMAIICGVSFLFGVIAILTICKNRKYFALTSRHINEIRKLTIDNNEMGFKNSSKYWADPNNPKDLDPYSTQFYSIIMILILTTGMLFYAIHLLCFMVSLSSYIIAGIGATVFVIGAVLALVLSMKTR